MEALKTSSAESNRLMTYSNPEYGDRCTPSDSRVGLGKDGRMNKLAGFSSLNKDENLIMILDNPSSYQIGVVLYIGGERNHDRSGCSSQKLRRTSRTSRRTGSARWTAVAEGSSDPELVIKFVRQATITAVES